MKWKLNPVNPDIASNIIRHHQIKEVCSCPSTPKKIYLPSWNQLNPNELRPHLYSCRALIQPRRAASLGVIMFWNPPFTHPTPRIRNTDHQWMVDFHMGCYLLVSACFRLAGWISCLTNCAGITRQCFTSRFFCVKSTILCCFTATLRRPSSSGFSLQSSLRILKNTWSWSYSNSFPLQCIK